MNVILQVLGSPTATFLENALANAAGTLVGGLLLALLLSVILPRVIRPPNLNGLWMLETSVVTTKYNPYRGMLLRYKLLLLQEGSRLVGTAEKVYERADTERYYWGKDRTRVKIDGTLRKGYFSRSRLYLHMSLDGQLRESSEFLSLQCRGWLRRLHLTGAFSDTAGDSSGTVHCYALPLDQRLDEYRGFPIFWFGSMIEICTCVFYQREWKRLQERVIALRDGTLRTLRVQNLHLPVAALILAEDRRFYSHCGVDPIGIVRAAWRTIVRQNLQGGSTIEQQLVRVLLADYRRSVARKLKEIVLASRLHRLLEKELVPLAYLTAAYFGWRMNGVKQAAQRLGVDLREPTLEQSAAIVARIRFPEPQQASPARREQIEARKNRILEQLKARPYLSM